jgi:hypothetical protein
MTKYKLTLNIIGHKLTDEDLKEAFEYANKYADTPYHEDYSEIGGDGYIEVTAKLTQEGNDLKLEMIYYGEGETFEKRAAEIKNAVETRKLQNSLLYETPSDSSSKIASKITATIEQIE